MNYRLRLAEMATHWPSDEDVLRALAERPLAVHEGDLVCRLTRWGDGLSAHCLTVQISRIDGVDSARLQISTLAVDLVGLAVDIRRLGAAHPALSAVAPHPAVWRHEIQRTGPAAIRLRHLFDGQRISDAFDRDANYRQLVDASLVRFELNAGGATARVVVDSSCMQPNLRALCVQLDALTTELRLGLGEAPTLAGGEGEPWQDARERLSQIDTDRLSAEISLIETLDDTLTRMVDAAGRRGLVCPHCGTRRPSHRPYQGHGRRRSFFVCSACKRSFDGLQAQATNPPEGR